MRSERTDGCSKSTQHGRWLPLSPFSISREAWRGRQMRANNRPPKRQPANQRLLNRRALAAQTPAPIPGVWLGMRVSAVRTLRRRPASPNSLRRPPLSLAFTSAEPTWTPISALHRLLRLFSRLEKLEIICDFGSSVPAETAAESLSCVCIPSYIAR